MWQIEKISEKSKKLVKNQKQKKKKKWKSKNWVKNRKIKWRVKKKTRKKNGFWKRKKSGQRKTKEKRKIKRPEKNERKTKIPFLLAPSPVATDIIGDTSSRTGIVGMQPSGVCHQICTGPRWPTCHLWRSGRSWRTLWLVMQPQSARHTGTSYDICHPTTG